MTSSLYLTDTALGQIDLGPDSDSGALCDPYVVSDLVIGAPTVREVVRDQSLANGTIDDTAFFSSRIVSFNVAVNVGRCGTVDPQTMIDGLQKWLRPSLRPRLFVRIPRSSLFRSAVVRGVPAQVDFSPVRTPIMPVSFVVPSGVLEESSEQSLIINPSSDTEEGRNYTGTPSTYGTHYLEAGNRVYPPTESLGSRNIVVNASAPTNWKATIYGGCTDPSLFVNGTAVSFGENGGITLAVDDYIEVDTAARTVILNGIDPILDVVNITDWTWADIRFQPGDNTFRYDATARTDESSVLLRWRGAFL